MKSVIFDWSGVVKDAIGANIWIVNKIFKKHGLPPLSLQEFRENWQQPYMLFYAKYLPNISLEEEQADYMEAILSPKCPKSRAVIGMPELIKELKNNNVYLAVIASDSSKTVLPEIKEYGLENVFDTIITDVHDKTEAVDNLIKDKNLNFEDTFFIGDSNHEIEVARETGIKSIAVTWGFCSEERLKSKNPDFLVQSVDELEKILL